MAIRRKCFTLLRHVFVAIRMLFVHIFYSLCRCRRVVREHQLPNTKLCCVKKQQTQTAPTHNSENGIQTDDTTEHRTATKEGTHHNDENDENKCADTEIQESYQCRTYNMYNV